MLNDSLKNGHYGFLVKVFNLPSVRTVSEYNSIGGNSPDGVLYNVLEKMHINKGLDSDWVNSVSLKWDACHVADKVVYNMHTNEICGFSHDAFNADALLF